MSATTTRREPSHWHQVISLRLPPDLMAALRKLAKDRGQPVSEVIRNAVSTQLSRQKAVADL